MKTSYLLPILLVITENLFAQVRYEPGYFIDDTGKKVECLIKNYDWKNNPVEFEYKLTENDQSVKGILSDVREFAIVGTSKFIRATVQIDRSGTAIHELTNAKDPEWSQVTIFLKVLLEGKASLFYYEERNLSRFFFSTSDSSIHQLVYKQYLVDDTRIATNSAFRQQLWNEMRCKDGAVSTVTKLNYRQRELQRYFIKFHDCKNEPFTVYNSRPKTKRDFFNLRITPGINHTTLKTHEHDGHRVSTIDFGSKTSFRIGMEAEFLLPFNKNKWGIIVEPSYQTFAAQALSEKMLYSIDYKSVQFQFGVKHYFYLSNSIKVFLNGFIIPNGIDFNSTINYKRINTFNHGATEIRSGVSFAGGLGVSFKRVSGEVRYYTDRNILTNYLYRSSDNVCLSFIVGYRIF